MGKSDMLLSFFENLWSSNNFREEKSPNELYFLIFYKRSIIKMKKR